MTLSVKGSERVEKEVEGIVDGLIVDVLVKLDLALPLVVSVALCYKCTYNNRLLKLDEHAVRKDFVEGGFRGEGVCAAATVHHSQLR